MGMKQQDLADALGISVHTLRGWEMRGVNKLPFERVIKLADAIGCDIRNLYDDEN
jgi:DNA-binding transcriptional regulator YiaG